MPLDREQLGWIEEVKGFAFVALTALAMFLMVGRARCSLLGHAHQLAQQAAELAEGEARWRHLMSNLSDVAWFMSPDGQRMLYVSPAIKSVCGRTDREFIDDPQLWARIVHPEDRMRVLRSTAMLCLPGDTRQIEYRIRHADGRWCWVRDRASVLVGSEGEPAAIGGVAEDITAARQARDMLYARELQLSGIVETAMDAIITVDAAQRIVVFNRAAAEVFRIEAREAIGEPLDRFIPARLRARHAQHVEGFVRTGVTQRRMGVMHMLSGLRADGEEFPIEAAISRSGEGEEVLMTVVLRDITEAQQAAAAVEAQRAAEAASRAKTEFLSRMSHELRTPLNAVLGFSQLLQASGEPLSERQRGQIEHIRMAGWHLLALINDVLDVSRIEAGALQILVGSVDADASVEEAVTLSQSLAERYGVRLVGPRTRVDCSIRVDPIRWRQVLLNLLSNAAKYNRPGGRIDVTLHRDGEQLQVHVRDTGLGMSAEQLAQLYEPFNRLGRQHGGIEGTGIGLTLTRELLQLMEGHIDVQSAPGQGTCVVVSVPSSEEAGWRTTTLSGCDLSLDDDPPRGTVLYIEDNAVNALIVEQLMARWPGITLMQAEDGATGIALAEQLRPDLVLLDMHLPDMNGQEVLDRLRALGVATRVVALSASAMPDEVAAARAAGAVDYWSKPLDFRQFEQGMKQLLGPGGSNAGACDEPLAPVGRA